VSSGGTTGATSVVSVVVTTDRSVVAVGWGPEGSESDCSGPEGATMSSRDVMAEYSGGVEHECYKTS
jgi:hypothetical protein